MLEQQLMEYLPDPNTVKANIGAVVDKLQEQAPLLVQEILRWSFAKNATLLICTIVVLYFICTRKKMWNYLWEDLKDDFTPIGFFGSIFMIAVIGVSFVSGISCFLTCIQIWIAPRLFLLEYISHLFK